MLQAVLVWSGLVLAFSVMLVMALGPAVVELDSWWYERKLRKRGRPERVRRAAVSEHAGQDEMDTVGRAA